MLVWSFQDHQPTEFLDPPAVHGLDLQQPIHLDTGDTGDFATKGRYVIWFNQHIYIYNIWGFP